MEHIQNISNIIFDIKDNLTDWQFKSVMDNLGVVSKEMKTSNSITFDLDTPIIDIFMMISKTKEFKRFGREPLTTHELRNMVGSRITLMNGTVYTIHKFTNISMILHEHVENCGHIRRLINLVALDTGNYRFFPHF